ncbi:MAG: uridine kinase [Myxococcota bacterium]
MFVLGIAGGSASGKTTLARALADRLGDRCLLVAHDRYYRPRSQARERNFDHPDALDSGRLIDDLHRLKAGHPAHLPVYDFARHDRADHADRVDPRPVVIVEGILILAVEPLRELLDLRVYVDAPDDLRLARRIRRDVAERGRTALEVLDQYERSVRPMHHEWVASSRHHADVVVDGTQPLDGALEELASRFHREVTPSR